MRQLAFLAASLAFALSPVLALQETWEVFKTPSGVSLLLGPIAGVILAWVGKSPLKQEKNNG